MEVTEKRPIIILALRRFSDSEREKVHRYVTATVSDSESIGTSERQFSESKGCVRTAVQ